MGTIIIYSALFIIDINLICGILLANNKQYPHIVLHLRITLYNTLRMCNPLYHRANKLIFTNYWFNYDKGWVNPLILFELGAGKDNRKKTKTTGLISKKIGVLKGGHVCNKFISFFILALDETLAVLKISFATITHA